MRQEMITAIALAAAVAQPFPLDDDIRPMTVNRRREPDDDVPIPVTREVFNEVLTLHALEQVNAMPRAARHEVINAARERLRLRHRTDSSEAAAAIRADRERRKAEAFAKRQPKGSA